MLFGDLLGCLDFGGHVRAAWSQAAKRPSPTQPRVGTCSYPSDISGVRADSQHLTI